MAATTRLTFLYPHLLRTVAATSAANPACRNPIEASVAAAAAAASWARVGGPGGRRHKGSFAPRHGKAVAPSTWTEQQKQEHEEEKKRGLHKDGQEGGGDQEPEGRRDVQNAEAQLVTTTAAAENADARAAADAPSTSIVEQPLTSQSDLSAAAEFVATTNQAQVPPSVQPDPLTASEEPNKEDTAVTDSTGEVGAKNSEEPSRQEQESEEETKARQSREEAKQSGPLEAVMHMPAPEKVASQHPSMSPPPYFHHFDTYSLVKQLEDGGYSRTQATMAMKAIRASLAQNLDVAQQSLVSKSDVENETYLFTAACSELNTEVKNNRRMQQEHMRQERTHIQHEVDILTQSLNQELLTLNDNVRGMFNDRKMAAREEQKEIDSAVQKLNYKISIVLTSDAKSEIEGVRWILIRRSVLGIIFMAIITLGTLRYATYVGQQRKLEDERRQKEEEEFRKNIGKKDDTTGPDAAEILAAN